MSREKVLLIFPPSFWGHKERFAQPLGILMLATILKQKNPLFYRNVIRSPLLIKHFNKLRYHHLEKKGSLH